MRIRKRPGYKCRRQTARGELSQSEQAKLVRQREKEADQARLEMELDELTKQANYHLLGPDGEVPEHLL